MMQKTRGVDLRSLLREAFVLLGDEPASNQGLAQAVGPSAPVQRSAEDRSRTRQLVLEELARRREESQPAADGAKASAACTHPRSTRVETGLFGTTDYWPRAWANGRSASQGDLQARIRSRVATDVRELVASAYCSLMRRLPEDHVVLNPLANAEFIVRCRELGATVSEVNLNRTLLNNRKAGRHAEVLREPVAGLASETFDQISHAVEIAASLVQREWFEVGHAVPSVDDILCNPDLRNQLRQYVSALHESVDVVDCHLVLLAFRKAGRQAAARLADLAFPDQRLFAPLRSLDPDHVPDGEGVYRVLCKRRPVFVGATTTLRARIRAHLERGGAAFLPSSLPFQIDGPLHIEVFRLPDAAPRSERNALTRYLRLQHSEDRRPAPPDLNWRESGALFSNRSCVVRRFAAVG